jgi:Obg family GTPase CgtA
MIDLVKLDLIAGDGGHGRVSLHREKFRPKGGPDGGHGGAGGSIIVRGDKHMNTLRRYAGAKVFKAEGGQLGGKNSRRGRQGQDLVLAVPPGTVVWLLAENKISQFRRQRYEKPDWSELEQAAEDSQSLTESQSKSAFKPQSGEVARQPQNQVEKQETRKESISEQMTSRQEKMGATQEQAADAKRKTEGGRYRLDVTLASDQVGRDKYYLQTEGEPIPDYQPDPLQPLAWSEVSEQAESKIFKGKAVVDGAVDGAESQPSARQKALKLIEIKEHGQEVVLCQGGFGGRGNESFKSSTLQTPLEAEYGTPGERKTIVFELRLLADVGLVGRPNAGKSTFLSRVTKASPKIGSYPFTTLEPNLGVMTLDSEGIDGAPQQLVIADIPGLIQGASQGKGLGDQFLRHIANCQALAFMLYLPEAVVFDEDLSNQQKAQRLWEQYQQLRQELKAHHSDLLSQVTLLILNKIDLYSKKLIDAQVNLFKQYDKKLHLLSTATGQGLPKVKKALFTSAQQQG